MTTFTTGYDPTQLQDGLRTGTDGYVGGENVADPQYANQSGYNQNLQDVNFGQIGPTNYQPSY